MVSYLQRSIGDCFILVYAPYPRHTHLENSSHAKAVAAPDFGHPALLVFSYIYLIHLIFTGLFYFSVFPFSAITPFR